MLGNLAGLFLFIALTLLFGWLAVRAGQSQNPVMRWGVFTVFGVLVLTAVILTMLTAMGLLKVYGGRGNPAPTLIVESTPERIARGEHIAGVVCASCHSINDSLPLSGGKDYFAAAPLLGTAFPPNLTPSGPLKDWTDGEIIRAIREGVDREGHLLPIMSSQSARNLSDDDLKSVAAYLRAQPAIQNDVPQESLTLLGVMAVGAGLIPVSSAPTEGFSITAPPKAQTLEYGKYVVGLTGCAECHGEDLGEGPGGLAPQGSSLRTVKDWTKEQFVSTLRTGTDPSGHQLDPREMPWKDLGRLDDEELGAIHAYIVSLG